MKRILISWLPIFIATTVIFGVVYGTVQQSLRQTANDPQIQLTEDGAVSLAGGYPPLALVGNMHVDLEKSLASFIIVYDESGHVVASSGTLNGSVPVLPSGVFDYAKKNDSDRLTWQPAPNVRIAAVVKYYQGKNSGFIVTGRSLKEIENRQSFTELASLVGWIIANVGALLAVAYSRMSERNSEFV